MSYMGALEAAGAKVIRYEYFGDYQGTILAEVEYDGRRGYVEISYGSCSYCDSYQAFEEDFDWDIGPDQEALAEFGRRYLDEIQTREDLLKKNTERAEWDTDAEDAIKWLKGNSHE